LEVSVKFRTIAEALLLLSLVIVGGVHLTDEDVDKAYYCEARSLAIPYCDYLSQYYGLDNGKCNNEMLGNKLCSSGWTPFSVIVGEAPGKFINDNLPAVKKSDHTTSSDGRICYLNGDLRRGVSCENTYHY